VSSAATTAMMRRSAWLGCLVTLATLAGGCIDDREKIATAVFTCNPQSRTADADCGAGFFCYSATQAVGDSICVPRCGGAGDKPCDGVCSSAGACLTRCTVPDPGKPDPCPSPLLCRRTTDSQLESAAGDDGVCLALNATCSTSLDCTTGVFNECTSDVNGARQGPRLLPNGEFCVQGQCSQLGISCEPGSACIRDILPSTIPAPDICSPLCGAQRNVPDGGVFNECLPGMTCLADAFPQTSAPACAPGFAGWLCVDDLGCTAGKCYDWEDVAPELAGLRTCAPTCKSDDDCVSFDRGGNPNVNSRNTCHDGVCRNLQSLFFPLTCLRSGDRCQLDPDQSKCESLAPDMGAADMGPPPDPCGVIDPTVMGLGAFGGSALTCVRECTSNEQCRTSLDPSSPSLEAILHVPLACTTTGVGTRRCLPIVPYKTACTLDDDCFGNLHCLPDVDNPTAAHVCTMACATSADCTAEPTLGSTFACSNDDVGAPGECIPKIVSGCPAATKERCISGNNGGPNGTCVSPLDWACTADNQCSSGHCLIIDGTSPPFGRCE
jgi:hypothetical protein